jgi:type VI secretion system protein ImpA
MSAIDVEQLLREVSPDSPCGDDLEYDAAYLEMTRAAAGKPAREMGGQVIPAEEPDWRAVRDQCLALLGRTKDLRVAVTLAQAVLRTDGLAGLASGLALARGLVERYWEGVHPRLDPDDQDPVFRMNTLAGLAAREGTVAALRLLPLASSRRLGRYGLRDFEIANGTLPKPEGAESVPDLTTIEAAFLDMDAAELEAGAAAAQEALGQLAGLDQAITNAVGAASGADLSLLQSTLRSINGLLQVQRGRRGLGGDAAAAAAADAGTTTQPEGRPAMSGPIQSREDVIRSLDQVCDWYAKYEPSSPVPLLLRRAKRLVNKSFLEAVQDLTPGGLGEIQTIAGVEPQS